MKKKKIQKIEFINFGIFPGHCLFAHQFSYEELIMTIDAEYNSKRWKDDEPFWKLGIGAESDKRLIDYGDYMALSRELVNASKGINKKLFYLIIKSDFKFTDYEYCKLAHEVVHLCQFYLPDVLDRNKEPEAEAYLHTHIMDQVLKILRSC